MNLYHSTMTGAVTGACLAFAVCIFNDVGLADSAYRIFILGIGGAWVGFLLSWLNIILPQFEPRRNHHQPHHQEHHT